MPSAAKTISEMAERASAVADLAEKAYAPNEDAMRDAFGSGTVFDALNRVMRDVQAIGKKGYNEKQKYSFRGIDGVVNAVGPAFREHGVVVVPIAEDATYETFHTSSGTLMHSCTLKVRFRFYGPAGDYVDATAYGESADAGDKATPKAHSVAFRTALLQVLTIPTDEPDPDTSSYQRATAPPPPPSFDLGKFLATCRTQQLDPADVLAFAEINLSVDQLAAEHKPALLAALKALKASGAGADQSRVSVENDVSNDPAPAPEENRQEGETNG